MPATLETAKFDLTRDVWPLHFPPGTVRKSWASSPEHGLLFVGKAWQNSFNRAKSLGDWGFSRLRCAKFASKSEISLNFARNTSKPNMHSAVCWLLFARICKLNVSQEWYALWGHFIIHLKGWDTFTTSGHTPTNARPAKTWSSAFPSYLCPAHRPEWALKTPCSSYC